MKNNVWLLDVETYLEIFELAKKHGKNAGDSMQEEFIEVLKNKREKFKHLGMTDKDIDLISGNLRENGLKIFNPKEEERRKNHD